MGKKTIFLLTFIIFIFVGFGLTIVNQYYPLDYLYSTYILREFDINPRVEIKPERKYEISIWYYPFFRTLEEYQGKEKFFLKNALNEIKKEYPNFRFELTEVNFLEARDKLNKAIQEGYPPDIFLNLSGESLKNLKLQVPVEDYLNQEEKEKFYTFNENISKLWNWPFLVHEQKWLVNEDISNTKGDNFFALIEELPDKSLALNYKDETLLRQLLTLKKVENLKVEDGDLVEDTYEKLKEIFNYFHQLRKQNKFAASPFNMDEIFLKLFYEQKPVVSGPINPWLENLLDNEQRFDLYEIQLNNLVKVYDISIFRQEAYPGDDHVKAVMETGKFLAKDYSQIPAKILDLKKPYNNKSNGKQQITTIMEISSDGKEYWAEKIIPLWEKFWEQGLTPEETIKRIY